MNFSSTVLNVTSVTEGPFLSDVDLTSWDMMPPYIDNHAGIVKATSLLWTYPPAGASGNGTLCTITFQVKDVGNTTLHFYYTQLTTFDGMELLPIEHTAEDGYFSNVPVELFGWINGSVTDFDTGLPLAGVSVEADVYFTTTDASGNYELEVEPGTYTVNASLTGYETSTAEAIVVANATVTVDFALVPITEVGWINGSVTDFDTGLPLAGVSVEADVYFTTTDASGNYELEVEPGTYTVTVSLAGYGSSKTDVTVIAGETITVDFELRPVPLTIDTLIMLVEDFIDQGEIEVKIQNSLLKKLYVAKVKLDAGKTKTSKNILNSFINHLRAQSGKHVDEYAANILIADAKFVINSL